MNEIWKTVKDYKTYEVSNCGNIRKKLKSKYRNLKPFIDKDGYLKVCLCENNIRKYRFVHRIVAINFIDNPQNKETVNHKDGNKQNNNVVNLEWATVKEQNNHALKTGLRIMPKNETHRDSKKVAQYDMNMNLIKIYPSVNEAKRQTGFSQGHISEVCRGEKKQHKKYIWKYC